MKKIFKLKKTIRTLSSIVMVLMVFKGSTQVMGSMSFNGIDNYVEITNSPLNTIGTGNFTIEAWVKGNETQPFLHPVILSNRGSDPFGGGIMLFFHDVWGGSQHKMLSFQVNAINYLLIDNGSHNGSLLDNDCHHVAVSRNGETLSFYADGVLMGSKVIPNFSTVSFNGPLLIGKDYPTNNTFNGLISQCRIWNQARTASEIFDNKDVSLTGTEPGLVSYWEMNDGNGQTLLDKTNQYSGILGNGTSVDNNDPQWSIDGCVETITDVTVVDESIDFNINPNPVVDHISIQNPTEESVEVRLFDQTGRLILTQVLTDQIDIEFTDLPKGSYFLSLNSASIALTKKILKI